MVSNKGVHHRLKRLQPTGSYENYKKSGRKRVTTKEQKTSKRHGIINTEEIEQNIVNCEKTFDKGWSGGLCISKNKQKKNYERNKKKG